MTNIFPKLDNEILVQKQLIELCGVEGLIPGIDSASEYIQKTGKLPYIDPFTTQQGIDVDDAISVHGRCVSKKALQQYLRENYHFNSEVFMFDGTRITERDLLEIGQKWSQSPFHISFSAKKTNDEEADGVVDDNHVFESAMSMQKHRNDDDDNETMNSKTKARHHKNTSYTRRKVGIDVSLYKHGKLKNAHSLKQAIAIGYSQGAKHHT